MNRFYPLLLLCIVVPSLSAQDSQTCNSQKAQDNLTELYKLAHTVGEGEEGTLLLFDQLERTMANLTRVPGGYHTTVTYGSDGDLLHDYYPTGHLSAKLFRAEAIGNWIGAIQSGTDCYPPMDEIFSAWKAWEQHQKDLMQVLSEMVNLEGRKNDLHANGVSSEGQLGTIQEQIDHNVARARSDLDFSIDIPKPIGPSDRSPSPFDGPVNRSTPDRVSIWTDQASAPLGSTIQATVGLGSKEGPNAVADKDYVINLHCEGCVVNINGHEPSANTKVNIPKGSRSTQAPILIQKPLASIRANAKGLKPTVVIAEGCEEGQDLHLVTNETQSWGITNGPAIPFALTFEDSKNNPATNGSDRAVRFGVTGDAIVQPRQGETGIITGGNYQNGDPIRLRGSECMLKLEVRSTIVGHVSVSAFYRDTASVPNPEFDFYYALGWWDYIAGILGVLLGFATKDAFWKKKQVGWWQACLTSLAGGALLFVLAYLIVAQKVTYPWLVFGAFSLAGSIAGVGAAKVFLSNATQTTVSEPTSGKGA